MEHRGVKNIIRNKKTIMFLVAFLILACGFFVPDLVAHAVEIKGNVAGDGNKGLAYYLVGKPLEGVQACMILITTIAASLFGTVIDPSVVSGDSGILNKQAIKNIWIMVRDILNMFFILVLLFSAFCTIFQVEKWNLRKVWLSILINALLVNFSYPIARFFIDISNVAMYYFVNNMFTFSTGSLSVNGSRIMANFGSASQLSGILTPGDFAAQPIAYELMIIIFTFIFGMTLLTAAVLFVVRLVALAILIMFSPIGFVANIFPETSEYASKWWKNLFSYSFFAPIMIFMMSVALQVSRAIGDENSQTFLANANVNADANVAKFIAHAAFFSIPIIILWMSMGIAKSSSMTGAETAVSKATEWGKNLRKFGYTWAIKKPIMATGIPGGAKQRYDKFIGGFTASQKQREAKWADRFGVKGSEITDIKNRAAAYKKDNISSEVLKSKLASGDMAAGLTLAEAGKVGADDYANIQKLAKSPDIAKHINRTVEKKNIDAVIKYRVNEEVINKGLSGMDKQKAENKIAIEEFDKLNADSWKSQENLGNMFDGSKLENKVFIRNGHESFNKMTTQARADVGKGLSGKIAKDLKDRKFEI